MATDTAPTAHPAPRRQIWQLPVFALGVAAAVAAWKVFPPPPASAAELHSQHLRALQLAVEKRASWREVETLLSKLAVGTDLPAGDPQVQYLLGSAHVVLAEQGAVDAAADRWAKANEVFSRFDPAALESALDQSRCRFRSAKAAAAVGVGDPAAVLAALDVVPAGEEPGERARLIADTCLRATPPDLKRAKGELTTYLTGPARGTPASLARYKLKLGELCVASGEPEKARKWLAEIGPTAAAESLVEAKRQLAQLAAAERAYDEAVKHLQAAEKIPGVPVEQRARVRLELGRGLLGLNRAADGREALERAASDGGPAGAAARVRLAELLARDKNPKPAVDHLIAVTDGLAPPAEFRNPHVGVAELRAAFDATIGACKGAGEYEAALRAAAAYKAVAENARDRHLTADVRAAWGEAILATQPVEAKGKLTQAAAEFQKLADESAAPAEQVNWLNRALACYRSAGDTANVSAVLTAMDAIPGVPPEVKASVCLARGEQLVKDGKFAEGERDLRQASLVAGPVGTRATVKLAVARINEGVRLTTSPATEGEGRGLIQLGQDLLSQVANKTYDTPDGREAHEEALFELGRLLVRPSLPSLIHYSEAETRFRRLLQEYPAGRYAETGGLYLGIALTQQALGANKGTSPPDRDRKLAEAQKVFEGLSQAKDPWVRTHADIRVVHTMLHARQFDALPKVCGDLAERYRGRVQELIVLSTLYTGYKMADRSDLAKGVAERMETAFATLPDAAYGREMEEEKKAYWVAWFAKNR
jgi:uncharacterized protein with PhoU and TrkA domain